MMKQLVLALLFARASASDPLGPTGEYCGGGARVRVHSELRATVERVGGRAARAACEFVASGGGGGALMGACRDLPALALAYDAARNRMTLTGAPGDAAVELSQELCHAAPAPRSARAARPAMRLPTLNISAGAVVTAGCSHAGDFASQFHIAFSSMVDGACVFSGRC